MGAFKSELISFLEKLEKESGCDFFKLQESFLSYVHKHSANGYERNMEEFKSITMRCGY